MPSCLNCRWKMLTATSEPCSSCLAAFDRGEAIGARFEAAPESVKEAPSEPEAAPHDAGVTVAAFGLGALAGALLIRVLAKPTPKPAGKPAQPFRRQPRASTSPYESTGWHRCRRVEPWLPW